jgi:hypothetical protein
MGFFSKLFGKKPDPNIAKQEPKIATAKSKQELIADIRGKAGRIGDSEIRDLLIRLSAKIEGFAPCADRRAVVLDEKIRIMVDAFLREMLKFDEDALFDDAGSEQITAFKRAANLKMFKECWQVLDKQLQDRKSLMEEVEKSEKEVAAMSAPARANYQKAMIARENIDRVWDIQTAAMEYNLKLAHIFCQIQCLQFDMERLLKEAAAQPENELSIGRKYTALEREVASLQEQERSLYAEIDANAQIKELIDKNALVKFYNVNNSKDGLGIAGKVAGYAAEALEITEIYEEDSALTSAALEKGLGAHKETGPAAVPVSDGFRAKLEEEKMRGASAAGTAAATGVSQGFAEKLAAMKQGEKPE